MDSDPPSHPSKMFCMLIYQMQSQWVHSGKKTVTKQLSLMSNALECYYWLNNT